MTRTRRVGLVPVLHDAVDLGRYAERVDPARAKQIDAFWRTLTSAVLASGLDWSTVDLLQDGLPVCGQEVDIVRELAQRGSANHRLLNTLVARGAALHGTEDPELLVREVTQHARTPDPAGARALLDARDRFIAGRVAAVARPERVTLVFLGAAHQVEVPLAELAPDVVVSFPFGRPPHRG